MFDILFQNNASREFTILTGLTNTSTTDLYLQFEGIELDVPEGEYTYAVLCNSRYDVQYETKTPILDTIVHTNDGDVILKDLCPLTGLMRVGEIDETNVYDTEKADTFPYDGKKDNNSTIYYEG